MQYLGGKSRIAKPIAQIIRDRRGDRQTYIEPFLGAGSVALALADDDWDQMYLADTSEDLILLWRAVAHLGWTPPTTLTEDEYRALRDAEPSALRGFAGFPCSFGGKWFGGYARDPKGGRNFADTASRSMVRRGLALRQAWFYHQDYRDLGRLVGPDAVVYADPPYAGTTAYGAVDPFDSTVFWATMREWSSRGALVLVSEYTAPDDAIEVWSARPQTSLSVGNQHADGSARRVTERLFVLP